VDTQKKIVTIVHTLVLIVEKYKEVYVLKKFLKLQSKIMKPIQKMSDGLDNLNSTLVNKIAKNGADIVLHEQAIKSLNMDNSVMKSIISGNDALIKNLSAIMPKEVK
jgi:hypothetical protein